MTWRGLDHRTIYEMVVDGGQGVGVSDAAEASWKAAHQAVLDADGDISAALRASESEWQGAGAEAMRTAFSPLAQWAVSAATSAAGTAGGVGDQAVLAMETRRIVADNAPPQNFFEHVQGGFQDVFSWDGQSMYDDRADAVDGLMTDYESSSVPNEQRFDTWSVPPTVVVTPAVTGPSGSGGGGVGPIPDTAGLAPAGGGSIASALAPGGGAQPVGGGSAGVGGVAPGSVPPGGGAGTLPGITGAAPGAGGMGAGSPGAGSPRAGSPGSPGAGAGAPGSGGAVAGAPGSGIPGSAGAGAGRSGVGGSGPAGAGSGVPGSGGRGLGTGGVAHPSERPLGSRGGSGTGPGPWSRAATGSGGSPAGAAPFRPVVPVMPPRTSTPDWRSVLLPPERDAAVSARTPGESAARSAGPGGPGGTSTTQGAAAAQGSGPRATGSPGMHPPMMGGGAGGSQGEERRRASYLVDDSDAFVDRRWFSEPVITPDDPL